MKTEHSQKDESDAHMKRREEGEKMKKEGSRRNEISFGSTELVSL